jgi:hypothetical protein
MTKNYNNTQTLKDWPGAFGAFKPSREAMRRSLSTFVYLILVNIGTVLILSTLLRMIFGNTAGSALYDVLGIVVGAFFVVVTINAYLTSVRGKRIEFQEALEAGVPFLGRMVLLDLLVVVTVIGGLILLIIPGIYFALRLSLAPYFLVDKNMGVMEAYKASWDATKGHVKQILGMIGVFILMFLPCITIIGVIASIYLVFMYSAVYAMFYLYVSQKHVSNEA